MVKGNAKRETRNPKRLFVLLCVTGTSRVSFSSSAPMLTETSSEAGLCDFPSSVTEMIEHLDMKKTFIAAFLTLTVAAASCSHRESTATVVFVLRHAEKAVGGDDPPLTEAGLRRAQALIQVVEYANIRAIYTSQFIRTHETAQPLSDKTGVPVTEVPVNLYQPGDYGQQLAKEILAKHAGECVVVVGHQNTVPGVIQGLSGQTVPGLRDLEYGSLFIIVIPSDGAPRLIRAQYGLPDG